MGLYPSSRAELALLAKITSSSSASSLKSTTSSLNDSHGGEGAGTAGMRMQDAVDIVMRCLEIDPRNRPTAQQVVQHCFVLGATGWSGYLGWQAPLSD